jgi:uncharacterized protein DUF6491
MIMKRSSLLAPLVALGVAAAPAMGSAAESAPAPAQEASIAFADHGGIRDWRGDDERTLYLQDRFFRWYKATLMSPAPDLRTALAVRFDTGASDRFDRFSWVVVRGQRYAVQSLVRIEGKPPSRHVRSHGRR